MVSTQLPSGIAREKTHPVKKIMTMTEAINVSPPSRRRFYINLASNWKVPVSSLGPETSYLDKSL